MGEVIKCNFNLFKEGRKYTGHHRNYILQSAISACYAPETREGIRLREKLGYFGHRRRELAGKLDLSEVEPMKMPDGSIAVVENVPSNITVFFEINKDGNVEHHQEILETAPGKVVSGLNASRVGGFSWACGGVDGGAIGATRITGFHGFDYVMNPGFSANRGYILENASPEAKCMIMENICKMGVTENAAEQYLKHCAASAQLRLSELEDQLDQIAIYEDAMKETLESRESELKALNSTIASFNQAKEARKRLILECAGKSVVVVPEKVLNAMLSMADEGDFNEVVGFYESAKLINLNALPLPGSDPKQTQVPSHKDLVDEEYGRASIGWDFGSLFKFFK